MTLSKLTCSDLEHSVYTRFCNVAVTRADNIAIIDAETSLDYQSLLTEVQRFAALIAEVVPPGEPVALLLPIDYRYPAAMLGALACGRPYVPLDRNFPNERLRLILENSEARAVIAAFPSDVASLDLPKDGRFAVVSAEATATNNDAEYLGKPHSAAYVIYTSGSTGVPKGVWQTQQGLLHDVMQFVEAVKVVPSDRLSLLYSPSVNGAIRDIFGALLSGAVLCMSDLRREGLAQVIENLRLRKVTIFHAMPPVLRLLVRASAGTRLCPFARIAYVAGDRFFNQDLNEARDALPPGCPIYTGIGSTECATLYRHWIIPSEWQGESNLVPVGHAIMDREMSLIGSDGTEVAPGEVGEIVVTSAYIAQGYWRNSTLTAQTFHPDKRGYRTFWTGDLGRMRDDGMMDFVGRADRQIKIRGYRVEPAEIEAVLRQDQQVAEAAILTDNSGESIELVAYVEGHQGSTVDTIALATSLAQTLPTYMQPKHLVAFPKLPRLGNFKLDLAALKRMHEAGATDTKVQLTSPTDMELWEKVAKRSINPDLTLQQLGLDSLELLEIELELERASGKPIRDLFQPMATPRDIHIALEQITKPSMSLPVTRRESYLGNLPHHLSRLMRKSAGTRVDRNGLIYAQNLNGQKPPLLWCFNTVSEFNTLAIALGPDQPLFGMRSFNGLLDPGADNSRQEIRLADLYAEAILDSLSDKCLAVGGNCQAGAIAMRLASTLAQARKSINILFLMEKMVPVPYAGRLVVLYGQSSKMHNPKFHFRQPTAGWDAYYHDYSIVEIQGEHGKFFDSDNIDVFAGTLARQMAVASYQYISVMNPAAQHAKITCIPSTNPDCIQLTIENTSEIDWNQGGEVGILITLHSLEPGESQRPKRLPDAEMRLPVALNSGESWTGEIAFPLGLNHRIFRLRAGLCIEGVTWFNEDPSSCLIINISSVD